MLAVRRINIRAPLARNVSGVKCQAGQNCHGGHAELFGDRLNFNFINFSFCLTKVASFRRRIRDAVAVHAVNAGQLALAANSPDMQHARYAQRNVHLIIRTSAID